MVMHDESDQDVEDKSSRGIRHKAGSYRAPLDAYRVLVVAGGEKLIALTRLSLAKNGLEVKAATAYGALAKLDASAHDLVILDTVLPDLSGWEVLRRIRGSSEVPVMLLTNAVRLR
jgi:two-component system OmpR family response regulator